MNKVALTIEDSIRYWSRFNRRKYDPDNNDHHYNMNYSVCMAASHINAKAIIAYTQTGSTAQIASSFGPECPIFAITSNEITMWKYIRCQSHPGQRKDITSSTLKLTMLLFINEYKKLTAYLNSLQFLS